MQMSSTWIDTEAGVTPATGVPPISEVGREREWRADVVMALAAVRAPAP